MDDVVPLTALAAAIAEATGKPAPRHHILYRMILDGKLPARRGVRGYEVSVGAACKVLGLPILEDATH